MLRKSEPGLIVLTNDWNQNDEIEEVVTISSKIVVVFLYTGQYLFSFCVKLIVMFKELYP